MSLIPKRGPISGGSLVEISGNNLDMGSDLMVYVGTSEGEFVR